MLVLEGEAGMGKTTLWRACVEIAESEALLVLRAEPSESESALSFSALGDLLDPVLDEALAPLPEGQRSAVMRALVLEDVTGPPPDAHAVGVALLNAVRALAQTRSVLVALDDVQWLDAASASALSYAARRLRGDRIGVLASRRATSESTLVHELRRTFDPARFHELEVGPLDRDGLHHVVRHHLDTALPAPLLGEVHAASGGNALYALEIVRMLRRSDVSVEAGQPLPVPESLHDLVHARLLALPSETRDVLLVAAALSHPTTPLVERATDADPLVALVPALEAEIVELHGDRIVFTHPLLAAGAYELAPAEQRVEVHARLADLVDDPEARGRHLAASATEPSSAVAAALVAAAEHAHSRGAPRSAALLLERAAALTPPADERRARQRVLDAVTAHHEAGDTARARALLEADIAKSAPGPERARALVLLARVRSYDDDLRGASALFEQAAAEAEPGSIVKASAREGRSATLFRLRESLAEAIELSSLAAEAAGVLEVPSLLGEALATKAVSEAALARPETVETVKRALALQSACADRPILRQPRFAAAVVQFWHGDLEGASSAYRDMAARATELGDESSMPYVRVMLAQIECARSAFEAAVEEARAGIAVAEQAGQQTLLAYVLAVRAVAEAHLGRSGEAADGGSHALELSSETGGVPPWIFASWALAHLALVRGDADGALQRLEPVAEHHRREAIEEPGALPFLPDYIEALIESARTADAERALARFQEAAVTLGRPRAVAASQRCRGLLVAASEGIEAGLVELTSAVELAGHGDMPFEHARALLGLGIAQRRAKQRSTARETLEEAAARFGELSAALWAERARGELKRISGRAATPGALTPAEQRVAALVAEGKTNKEVAAALFLSDRTVEGHLARIFGKLGIRHRAEVARALQSRGIAPPNTGDTPVSAESSAS